MLGGDSSVVATGNQLAGVDGAPGPAQRQHWADELGLGQEVDRRADRRVCLVTTQPDFDRLLQRSTECERHRGGVGAAMEAQTRRPVEQWPSRFDGRGRLGRLREHDRQ